MNLTDKIFAFAALFLGFGLTGLQAQEAIPATGQNVIGLGGSVSYSVGQIVYSTNSGTTGTEAQGIQQPYEISVATGIGYDKTISLQCIAYPNPTSDFLTLKVDFFENRNLSYRLLDLSGRLLENKLISDYATLISMNKFVPTTYLLTIIQRNQEIITFKIIKN